MDVGRDQFNCTHDIFATRYQVDGSTIDVGVTQRIDGSEIEKTAIREVLRRMDDYFFNEVLAMPEYEYARSKWYVVSKIQSSCFCFLMGVFDLFSKNTNELCAFWSSVGEY